jgi:hypothetical protein
MPYVDKNIHKNYSSVAVIDEGGDLVDRHRAGHRHREELTGYLNQFPLITQVVMEDKGLLLKSVCRLSV